MRPNSLKETYDCSGYLYTVSAKYFEYLPLCRSTKELISFKQVPIIHRENIPNVLKALKDTGETVFRYYYERY